MAQDEIQKALEFARYCQTTDLLQGLMDLSWEWVSVNPTHVGEAVRLGRVFWWQDEQGWLVFTEDWEDDQTDRFPLLSFVACSIEDLKSILEDFRRLSTALGYSRLGWTAPLVPEIVQSLEEAGFEHKWEDSIYLYALM